MCDLCVMLGWLTYITSEGSFWSAVAEWLLVLSLQSHPASAAGQHIQSEQAPPSTTSKGVWMHCSDYGWRSHCEGGECRWYVIFWCLFMGWCHR